MTGYSSGVRWADRAAPRVALDDLASTDGHDDQPGPAALQVELAELLRSTAAAAAAATDDGLRNHAAEAVSALATPPGALGRLADLAVELAVIRGDLPPPIPQRATLIAAAGDHGVHVHGVTPWPQRVSALVASALAGGHAGASAFANEAGARTVVIDAGLVTPPAPAPRLVPARVVAGTRDLRTRDALSDGEVARAIVLGGRVTEAIVAEGGDLVAVGDLGIGNTTASAALIAACADVDVRLVTGRGTGIDDATLELKRRVVTDAVVRAGQRDAAGYLAAFGGAEHAALVGVLLAAASHRIPVVLDGVIACAAALVASRMSPACREVMIAGHRSPEPGAGVVLEALGLHPLLDLELCLGEGSGALAAIPLVRIAARLLHDVARLDEVLGGSPPER